MHAWARRIARDWPPEEVCVTDGWHLGYAGGVTFRANSAVLLDPAAARVETVERFYRERGAPPAVQVWRGMDDLDRNLAARGYTKGRAAMVMVRDIGDVGDSAALAQARVEVASRPDTRWRALWSAEGVDTRVAEGQHRIMDRVPVMGYAVETSGGARGCAAAADGWVGLYNMFTEPKVRGLGLAREIIGALLAWGRDRGAERAYLLVLEDNAAALRAYERAGFSEVDRYHYRVGEP
ncbi:GNAT family N-acetyltransferase [Nocardiopsis sp. EMB25]|uniref:GNAT family N-acetyltransferase n=1 Tax=Nocardiopsis sp. EMB25 TaxID=2835867 RepID=UPI0022843BD5|nr:GNAT family N-acetyltransferase [Nocardiopsis sp. EMB25]MCY9785004.1 GNAT family N-acetyltransferase [Nocardiopsis sp. EMB25]